ncbi:hypothetical protein PUNSTDRAFT_49803 [Punctularia strigosozonata HHB-11173 SS5]|uniref:uncharacterized protein n=1 Tax=Punctularia strigosozonata (strain HHB-11173) TaxID=741275 RepID=UPI0004417E26|nr:uncharacterized protein PUNSTDRAFT_49803 [Punctularia strigosozonata HHB-11173 SS5]EIN12496.1 hypothetical protein PUNSTDRAFT_49803 [Punctularia strigosozonata HHB-11173 SS5]
MFSTLRTFTLWALVASVLLAIPHADAAALKQAQMKDLRERATPVQARSPQASQMRARAPIPQVSQMRARAPAPQVSQMRARAPAPQVSQMRRAPAPQASQMRRAPIPQASQARREMTIFDIAPERRCRRDWQSCPIFVESKLKGFECVDVQHDLESCGGCVTNGQTFGDGGRDCSAIPNVDSVSCMKGQCIIEQCASGYVKSADGHDCVASKGRI